MESLVQQSQQLVLNTNSDFKRFLFSKIQWDWRLIGILGARGCGKTTLILQYLKQKFGISNEAVYVSLDDFYFTENRLIDFIIKFRQLGGKHLFVDEVHKYPDWARELKNAYDRFPDLKIVFTGSSILDILKQDVDLSRRAVMYHLPGLSFREYLDFQNLGKFENYKLENILNSHQELALQITKEIKPLVYFADYLKYGYYPYFKENISLYPTRLSQTLKLIIENDLKFIEGYDAANARRIEQLLYILATNAPFKPNISKLSEKIGIYRSTLVQYLHYLEKAEIINSLYREGISISILQKPEKIFLGNTNISMLLGSNQSNKGSLRETFFLSQIKVDHTVNLPAGEGDFIIDNKYLFETGGKNKTGRQIADIPDSFIVSDDMETGVYNKIPLWLFGFLY